MNEQYREAMGKALFLANRARETGDVPVGAVVVDADGHIIGRGWNCREADHDPTGHAEIVALREASRALGTWRLSGCTLIVTLEPCTMCAGAILASRIDRVVFGAWDPKAGAAGSLRDVLRDARMPHPTEVIGGVLAQEAAMQLRSFFLGRRGADEMPVVAAPVMPAVSPDTTRGPVTKSVPQIRPVHVRPTATVPAGIYTPAQPKRPAVQPLSDTVTPPPAPEPAPQIVDAPVPPVFPQRAKQRTTARPQRPLPQAFEPEPARRVDYELSPRQFSDVDPITSGIRVRRSGRRRGNARH